MKSLLVTNILSILPQLATIFFAFLLMMMGAYTKGRRGGSFGLVAALGLAVAFVINLLLWNVREIGFSGMVVMDGMTAFFNAIFLGAAFLVCLASETMIYRRSSHAAEYYALILFSVSGMSFIAASLDFITIFLGLELMSLSLYVLAGFFRGDHRLAESSMKYFLLGSFASAVFMLGVALIYGIYGTTNFAQILQGHASLVSSHATGQMPMLLTGVICVLVGILFKIGAVPFHQWAPDVYEGAPTPITAFMATAVKAASFAMLLRIFLMGLKGVIFELTDMIAIISAITMTVGNLSALRQTSIKRMLAFSSIAHAGYLLAGFVSLNYLGVSAILFYLVAYTCMNAGAFIVLQFFEREGKEGITLDDVSGMGFRHPFSGFSMVICMFSLMGLPPLGGFMGKLYIFSGAIKAGFIWLAIVGVLNSVISAFYYSRVLVHLFFHESQDRRASNVGPESVIAVALSVAGVLLLGVWPTGLLNAALQSLSPLF